MFTKIAERNSGRVLVVAGYFMRQKLIMQEMLNRHKLNTHYGMGVQKENAIVNMIIVS
jgi:hypothetical protein